MKKIIVQDHNTTGIIGRYQIKNAELNTPAQSTEIGKRIEKDLNRNNDGAFELLRTILCESSMENEYDQDIYNFLKENNELPKDYVPYW